MQRDRLTRYDVLDLFMGTDGRASLDSHIIIAMALLAGWWIVSQTLAGKDVSDKMIDVLMIFVIYRASGKAIDAFAKRPAPQMPDQNIDQQVVVTPVAPELQAVREVRSVRATKMSAAKTAAPTTASGKPLPKE